MEDLLLNIANQLPKMRKQLDLTQKELANKLGIGRSTLTKIEKNPSRLSKSLAIALFVVIKKELKERRKGIEKINFEKWDNIENRKDIIKELRKFGLNKNNLSLVMQSAAFGAIIGNIIGKIFTGGLLGILGIVPLLLADPQRAKKEDKINSEHLKKITQSYFDTVEKELKIHFGFNEEEKFNVFKFVDKLENN